MKKQMLNNGLMIYYYPIEQAYSTTIGLYVNTGSRYEPVKQNGITHMLEHLHFRKLGNLSQKELYREMDKIGSTIRASTHKELLRFYMKVRPCYFAKGIDFIKDIVSMNTWSEDDVEAEKKVVLNELYEKESQFDTQSVIDKTIWNHAPLSMSIIGNADTINNLTLEHILDYKKKVFSKGKLAVVVTGYIDSKMMYNCEESLSELVIPEGVENIQNNEKVRCEKNNIKLVDYSWEYVDVDISFLIEKNFNQYELTLLNSILGGGTGSKLQYYLREKMGITYSIYSYLEMYSDVSAMHISFSTHKSNIYDSIKTIVSVLNGIKTNVTEPDMETNLPYYSENLWFWLEDSEFLNLEIGWDLFGKSEPIEVEKRIELYKKVSYEQLMNIASEIFKSNKTCVTIIGSVNDITQKKIRTILKDLT